MGLLLSKIFQMLENFSMSEARILMLGLDAAGKTTILYKLKLNETITTLPTIGFNVETVTPVKNVTFTVWDVGGQEKLRPLWRHYYHGTEGLIFVIDSSDISRVQEARKELFSIVHEDGIDIGVPVVIFANKQDLPNALRSHELVERLGLRDMQENPWFIQEMCAVTGEGLYEGIHRLSDMVKDYQKNRFL